MSLFGLICFYLGCRNPRNVYLKEKNQNKLIKQQLEFEIASNDDYVSMSMIDPIESNNSNKLFSGSRLMTVPEYEESLYSSKEHEKMRKKRFLRDHL
jgi:hypothetical protein